MKITCIDATSLSRRSSAFVFRRMRNFIIITSISLCFVFMHCQIKKQWIHMPERAYYKENFQKHKLDLFNLRKELSTSISLLQSTSPEQHIPLQTTFFQSTNAPQMEEDVIKTTASSYGEIWINQFTSGLPKELEFTLQNIVTRDFYEVGESGSKEPCKKGYFRLHGMEGCREWLKCSEVDSLVPENTFGNGVGKLVKTAVWRGIDVVIVSLREDRIQYKMFVDRVSSGVWNMLLAQPSPYVTQVVGLCDKGNHTVLVMENCKLGNFRMFYTSSKFRKLSKVEKLKFAVQIVASFDYLHRGMGLPRVHCDLHTVMQSFGQWVVSEDNRLFLSDLDELPIVNKMNKTLATCITEPFGKMDQPMFLAPEIRYSQTEFNEGNAQKPVDQSSDIWKIPDLAANILVKSNRKRYFETYEKYHSNFYYEEELRLIHDRCKFDDPSKRPSSLEILIEYLKLYQKEVEILAEI